MPDWVHVLIVSGELTVNESAYWWHPVSEHGKYLSCTNAAGNCLENWLWAGGHVHNVSLNLVRHWTESSGLFVSRPASHTLCWCHPSPKPNGLYSQWERTHLTQTTPAVCKDNVMDMWSPLFSFRELMFSLWLFVCLTQTLPQIQRWTPDMTTQSIFRHWPRRHKRDVTDSGVNLNSTVAELKPVPGKPTSCLWPPTPVVQMSTWPVFPRGKTQWNKCFVSSLSLTCGWISPLPLWEMVQKQTATGQDVVTLSLHYLQPTSQTADHNKCLSYHNPIYLWFSCLLSSCGTT